MKSSTYNKLVKTCLSMLFLCSALSCKKNLDNVVYGGLAENNFFKTEADVRTALNAMYTGLMENGGGYRGWGSGLESFRVQSSTVTDELVCNWGQPFQLMGLLNYTPDNITEVVNHYPWLMRYISEITVDMAKTQQISMNANAKKRYIAEFKGLRGYYSSILFSYFGPVPIRVNATEVDNPDAPVLARPTTEAMISQITRDLTEASIDLPDKFTGADYGRFSKAAALTALMKVQMQQKNWPGAISTGNQIKAMNFSLVGNYEDNFNTKAKGGNSEIILTVVCNNIENSTNVNLWLPHVLPTDYYDPSGIALTAWNGYRVPWKTYDKFNQQDKRLKVLLQKYPTGRDANGSLIYKDARAAGDQGAVPVKFGPDISGVSSQNSNIDMPIFRYADVELLLAEALNEQNGGPTIAAFDLINDVRKRAGLNTYTMGSQNQTQFRSNIQNERLFELWNEGVRRDDLIRWGLFVKRALDDGSPYANENKILFPIPRSVVNQSNGIIKQNPGYN